MFIAGAAKGAGTDPLSYRWLDGATEVSRWRRVRSDGSAPVELCGLAVGQHVLTLQVTDGKRTASEQVIATISEAAATRVARADEPARQR